MIILESFQMESYMHFLQIQQRKAGFVQERFEQNGYSTEIVEKIAVCSEE